MSRTTAFYVSPKGDDAWSGRLRNPNRAQSDGPFSTLSRARDAIRALPPAERVAHPITVYVRGGSYYLSETLVFVPEDSGTFACPITYAAYPGERPIVSGGKVIQGPWRPWQGQIMVCDVPGAAKGGCKFRRLYVNGAVAKRSRFPKTDYVRIEGMAHETAFKYAEGHIQRYHNLTDVEVVVIHSWDESRLIIKELDEANRIVTFTGAPERSHYFGWSGARGLNRFYVEGTREGVTQPGDWYLDFQSGELYYWPKGDISKDEIVAPALLQLVRFDSKPEQGKPVQYLSFQGLTFSDTDFPLAPEGYPGCGDVGDIVEPSTLALVGARRCSVEGCEIRNTGTYALEITGPGNRVIGNHIHATGSGGVITRDITSERIKVCYNHIHDCGEVYPSAVGINIDDGGGIYAHNLIHDISHSGIYARHWATATQPLERSNQNEGITIEYNEIYDCIGRINDGSAIFVRDSDMIIRNNLIHDCTSNSEGTPGWGIYLGCRSRNARVENNVVYRSRESVHIWYGNENTTWINNIFVDGLKAQINYTNAQETQHINIRFLRNIVSWKEEDALLFHVYGDISLPEESDYNLWCPPEGSAMRIARHPTLTDYASWRAKGYEARSIIGDPGFVDPAHDDYALKPDSPALKLGFEPIDLSHVGLRGSPWEAALTPKKRAR